MPKRYSITPTRAQLLLPLKQYISRNTPTTTPITMPAACDQVFHNSSFFVYLIAITVGVEGVTRHHRSVAAKIVIVLMVSKKSATFAADLLLGAIL